MRSYLKTRAHHKPILRTQLMVRDLGLSGEVRRRVVVRRDELGVLVLVELIGPRLQHAPLQLDAPFELYVPESAKRHEEAEQPLLAKTRANVFNQYRAIKPPDYDHQVAYLTYDGLPLRRRVFATNSGHFLFILGVMVVGERVSGEGAVLLLHPQHRPSVPGIGYKPAEAEDGQTLISKGPVVPTL